MAAASLGLEVWGVDISLHSRPLARIFVDRKNRAAHKPAAEAVPANFADTADFLSHSLPDGVTIEECAELSRLLGLALEVDSVFSDAWILEVSSPGFERMFFTLDQMRAYVGQELDVALSAPVDGWPGRKKFKGRLVRVGEASFTLHIPQTLRKPVEPEEAEVPWDCVRRANLVYVFEEPEKPGKDVKRSDKQAPRPHKGGKKAATTAEEAE